MTEKKFWCRLAEPPIFYASVHYGPTLILQVSSKSVQVWGVATEKPFRDVQSEFNRGFFEPITIDRQWTAGKTKHR